MLCYVNMNLYYEMTFLLPSPLLKTFKAAKYELQKPSTWRATLFRCKFGSMFPVFHLA